MMEKLKQKRIAMGVSYCGKSYYGWQRQRHEPSTVQAKLEHALSQIANTPIETICAGRTDTGVHGTGQVIHFDTIAERSDYSWKMGTNTHLPKNIRINWACEVESHFHARFSAKSRRYKYVIEDDCVGNAIFDGLVTAFRYKLDVDKMHKAAQYLLGERDFSSFRAAQCQSKTPFRHIDTIQVSRYRQFVIVEIQANAFLYHMVRNIVGALLLIGQGKQTPEWISAVLDAKDRRKAPATAPADGLYLVGVEYNCHTFPKALPIPFTDA